MKTEEYTELSANIAAKQLDKLKEYIEFLVQNDKVPESEKYQFLLSVIESTLLISYIRLNIYNHLTISESYSEETKRIIEAFCATVSSSDFLLKSLLPDSSLIKTKGEEGILNEINELSMQIQEIVNKEIESLFSSSTRTNLN